MTNLTKTQKSAILISVFWILIAAINSEHTIRRQSIFYFGEFFFLTSPIILYWSGVWIWGFGYLLTFVKNINNKIKLYKSTKFKKQNNESSKRGIGRLHYLIVTIINTFLFLSIPDWIFLGLPWQLAVILLRCRNLQFNWVIPCIIYSSCILIMFYLTLQGIDTSFENIDKTSQLLKEHPLYGLYNAGLSLKFIYMIYNLIFIFKPGKN